MKAIKKAASALLAVVLLVSMIPATLVGAEETRDAGKEAKEYFEDLGPGSYEFNNSKGNADSYLLVYTTKVTQKMGHGTVTATFVVNEDGTTDLNLELDSIKRDVKSLTINGTVYNQKSRDSYGDEGYYRMTFDTVENFDLSTLGPNVKEGYTHALKISEVKAVNTSTSTEDNLTDAWVELKLSDKDIEKTNEEESTAAIGVKIMRTAGSLTGKNNVEFNKPYKVSAFAVKDGKMTAEVTFGGEYPKMYWGELAEAKEKDASGSSDIINIPNLKAGETSINFNDIELDKPIKVSLYSSHMESWYEYEFTFYNASCEHDYGDDGICKKCGAIDTSNENAYVSTEEKVEIKSEDKTEVIIPFTAFTDMSGKELSIETKNGTVSFDADTLASILNGVEGNITLKMDDLTKTPTFVHSQYKMVFDFSLTDENGKNLFTPEVNGKAKITVPYTDKVAEGNTIKVYYIGLEGKEEVEAVYDAKAQTVTFVAEHFSMYGFEEAAIEKAPVKPAVPGNDQPDKKTTDAPKTGDNANIALFATVACAAVTALGVSLVLKKRSTKDCK